MSPKGSTKGVVEVVDECEVTARALRHWEKKGLISPARVEGKRRYGPADIARIELIKQGQKIGLTLGEIRKAIDAGGGERLVIDPDRCIQLIVELEKERHDCEEVLEELRAIYGQMRENDH